MLARFSIADHDYVSGLDNLHVLGNYTGNFCALMFNFGENSAFYKNADARRAIVHATNSEAILNTVYLGLGKMMHAVVVDYCFDLKTDSMIFPRPTPSALIWTLPSSLLTAAD
jgi:ABC-type transport system substrate-binding protein